MFILFWFNLWFNLIFQEGLIVYYFVLFELLLNKQEQDGTPTP